jgi:sortase (surface protein transpeptidase)
MKFMKYYEILTIEPDDVAQLMTDQAHALTLVTCDTNNLLRLVVKSSAINQH